MWRPTRCASRPRRRQRSRHSGRNGDEYFGGPEAAPGLPPRYIRDRADLGRARGLLRMGDLGHDRRPSRQGLLLHEQLAVRAARRQPCRPHRRISGARSVSITLSRRSWASCCSRSAGSTTSGGVVRKAVRHPHDDRLRRLAASRRASERPRLFLAVVAVLFLLQASRRRSARALPRGARGILRIRSRGGGFRTTSCAPGIFSSRSSGSPPPGSRADSSSRRSSARAEPPGQRVGALRALSAPSPSSWAEVSSAKGSGSTIGSETSGSGSVTRARSTSISVASGRCCSRWASSSGSPSCSARCAPRCAEPDDGELASLFLYAAVAIPVFYLPALFYGPHTNFAVIDNWRFWIIHLWVEGFFELFATVLVAVMFYQMGLVSGDDGDPRRLPRRHPLPGRRHRRHRAPLVLHRPGHAATWDWPRAFSAHGGRAADPADPRRVGLRAASSDRRCGECGARFAGGQMWAIYFLMAVGFWNFVGAGVFGFLINLPIVSYFEVGTLLDQQPRARGDVRRVRDARPRRRGVLPARRRRRIAVWQRIEKLDPRRVLGPQRRASRSWCSLDLFPGGVLQLWDSLIQRLLARTPAHVSR